MGRKDDLARDSGEEGLDLLATDTPAELLPFPKPVLDEQVRDPLGVVWVITILAKAGLQLFDLLDRFQSCEPILYVDV
jgi:hypothetical protein